MPKKPKTIKPYAGMADMTDLDKMLENRQQISGELGGLPDLDDLDKALNPSGGEEDFPDVMATVEYSGNAEVDSRRELDALMDGFNIIDGLDETLDPSLKPDDRPEEIKEYARTAKRAEDQFQHGVETDTWICIVFRSEQQVDEFCKQLGIYHIHDKYFDGQKIAKHLGVKLTPVHLVQTTKKPDKRLLEFVDEELVTGKKSGKKK